MGIGDSLDLIPVGAWHGNGRKAQWWSPVLLALRDPDSGRLVAMCKCMSGASQRFVPILPKAVLEYYIPSLGFSDSFYKVRFRYRYVGLAAVS